MQTMSVPRDGSTEAEVTITIERDYKTPGGKDKTAETEVTLCPSQALALVEAIMANLRRQVR
jgi:hypothetical protein